MLHEQPSNQPSDADRLRNVEIFLSNFKRASAEMQGPFRSYDLYIIEHMERALGSTARAYDEGFILDGLEMAFRRA